MLTEKRLELNLDLEFASDATWVTVLQNSQDMQRL
jgi:hypothetical protein